MQPFYAIIIPTSLLGGPHPEHPIVYPPPGGGGQPPGIWGPTDPRPTPPIVVPPGGTQPPLTIWPGPGPLPGIEHPIVIPPEGPPPGEQPPTGPLGKMSWQTVWTEEYGWAVVGVLADPHPTPSKR